ncbi:cell division protein FtsZ [Candidatus Roizmanbacteria bacterium RIFCSPHIGHO2_02_FULL_40_13b]|uniref:Cell division protein FtsZ n=1 Tax=Candidatus Roizmanbacteria bacterium RIFCSPHIGHO2_01_FULL_39_24 TaxID=1802032 RepID=A0A1F7GK51_9BACT|nr:MAG: cell division protein FtsZ [Candidatus Roizmanbacteria bacterium RIFCSPHIGHO2_01_FULL_39_24]OGK28052.1 MAG: cell division protein FtsZ [Candidatus Roizmanbacteria bacterium RIFCSPHIGHO2_02_FULL_40_13b]OGK49561.1 MAG: cell division protein FtsZ [Candidatus Roizmanbacteria bacterium RIFCSPLOWO2_01_FULL_40_32]OGK56095.1 MAG: cell division protein FtsZ [Candidatus Roizmanbacteria bacterium RIFCSPLOWO2_02_FULL_39_8]
MLIKPQAGQAARIKVVGIGGGGGNALATMIAQEDIVGVEFIALNTDAQALLAHRADTKIQIGDNLTKGLGSGGNPDIGQKAAEESRDKIKEALEGADMIFIACGEGGGTGTGAAPVVAEIGRETGALVIAVVTKPFAFEGSRRKLTAEDGVDRLRDKVDTLIVIPNQKVLEIVDSKVSMIDAFKKVDSILHQGVKGIAELITVPGLINVDFADVRSIMKDAGTALMGIGTGSGDKRTQMAIKQAISSPLLETSITGAKGVLFNVIGGPDLSMVEVDEAASIIQKTVDPDAEIIFGAVIQEKMAGEVKIIVIATKFDEHKLRFGTQFQTDYSEPDEIVEASPDETTDEPEERTFNPNVTSQTDDDEFDIPTFLRKK